MKRFALAAAAYVLLAGCQLPPPPTTGGTPLTPQQLQANAQTAAYWLQYVGCLGETAAVAASPIVAISADAAGNQKLDAISKSGTILCTTTVPAVAMPAPAPPNTPPATVVVPATPVS